VAAKKRGSVSIRQDECLMMVRIVSPAALITPRLAIGYGRGEGPARRNQAIQPA